MLARIAKHDIRNTDYVNLAMLDDNELINKENKEALFEILRKNPHITRLNLAMNDIDDELIQGLVKIPSIKKLDLCASEFSIESAKRLAENKHLKEIIVAPNVVFDKTLDYLKTNKNLSIEIREGIQIEEYLHKKWQKEKERLTTNNPAEKLPLMQFSLTNDFSPASSVSDSKKPENQPEQNALNLGM